jgi:hypothetical protein
VALRYAFPVTVYAQNCATDSRGRTVTMQSISSSLKVFCYPIWSRENCDVIDVCIYIGNGQSERHDDGRFP